MDANGLQFWMLSQCTDWFPAWRAGAPYVAGTGLVDPNGKMQIVQQGGISGGGQPAWNLQAGQSTQDGMVQWINCGPLTWQAGAGFSTGQYILDPNGNLQQVTAVAGDSKTGTVSPAWPTVLNLPVTDNNVTWSLAGPPQIGLACCKTSGRLQLRSISSAGPLTEDFTVASALKNASPMARDQYGNYARWDPASGQVMAGGSGPVMADGSRPSEVSIFAPANPAVTDLVLGYDGILYVAVNQTLVMIDRRDRWPNFTLALPDFNFWRLAALPEGGVLALDPSKPQLGKVAGQPLQVGPIDTPNPGILRSCQQNPSPPEMVARYALPAGEAFVALAAMDAGQFVVLSWGSADPANQKSFLRTFSEAAGLGPPLQLQMLSFPSLHSAGVFFPYSLAWLGAQKLAVLATGTKEALVFDLSDGGDNLISSGETYILADKNLGPVAHGFDLPPYYANGAALLPLLPLSLNSFAPKGATNPASPLLFDSGSSQTVWHRLFLEAVLPPRCGAIIWLTASDHVADFAGASTSWYPHIFGDADTSSVPAVLLASSPVAAWQTIPSEVPFAPTVLKEDPVEDRRGLFMALVQRANKVVRSLRGRYLAVRMQLDGDGRSTPEVAALRAYASRFSYVEHYLPEIYREHKFPPDADADGASTHRDFLERFIDLFEAQMTRIEDRVANSYLLTRPESCPADSLGWLGSWVGIEPNGYPPDRQRARLLAVSDLHRKRGTVPGITQALDAATNGMCSRGAIVVIEDFRLRHIFATILGANLSIQNDPLLPGYSGSSNSIVGDTLFLGDPSIQAELQALYETDLNIPGGAQAAQSFYDALANRLTVFIHDQVENVNIKLVQGIVEAEKPAHVQATIRRAAQPFMIGLASLLGINTYLGPVPPLGAIRVDVSQVGRYDVVRQLPSLDPRLE
jgi:phage tail-like protein